MARSLETRAPRPRRELSKDLPEENIPDIFAQTWDAPPSMPEVSDEVVQIKEPTLEVQLAQVEAVKESYSQFQAAVAGVGSTLLSFFTNCGVACLAHGHGLASSGMAFNPALFGGLHAGHDHGEHEDEEHAPHEVVKKPIENFVPKPKKQRELVQKPVKNKYIRASDLALFFLSSAVAV